MVKTTPKWKNASRRNSRLFGYAPYSPLRDYAGSSDDHGSEKVITIYSDSEEEENDLGVEIRHLKNEIMNIESERDKEIEEWEQKIEKAKENAKVRIIQIRRILRVRYEKRGAIKMKRAIKKKELEIKKEIYEELPKFKDAIIQTERIQQKIGQVKCSCCEEEMDINIGHCTNIRCAAAKCGACHNQVCTCFKGEILEMTPEQLIEEEESLPAAEKALREAIKKYRKLKESKLHNQKEKNSNLNNVE